MSRTRKGLSRPTHPENKCVTPQEEGTMATQTTSPRTTAASISSRGALASKKRQEQIIRVVATAVAVLGLLIVLFPLAWMISTSLKTRIEVLKFPPTWIPVVAQWDNYRVALTVNPFGKYFMN